MHCHDVATAGPSPFEALATLGHLRMTDQSRSKSLSMPKRIFLVHPTLLAHAAGRRGVQDAVAATRRSQRARRVALRRHRRTTAKLHARNSITRLANLFRHCEAERRRRHRVLRLDLRPGGGGRPQGHQGPGAAHRGGDDGRGGRARRLDPAGLHPEARACRWCAARSMPRRSRPASRSTIKELWVSGARDALNKGDNDKHDRLIAEQSAAAGDFDTDRARHDVDGAGEGEDAAGARAARR